MTMYKHWTKFKGEWLWPNFTPRELSCKCCGEYYHDPYSLNLLQSLRNIIGKAVIVNSGHRCKAHNIREGGKKKSQHLRIAFDISLENHTDHKKLLAAMLLAGFSAFGLYNSFIHADRRINKLWVPGNRKKWRPIVRELLERII